MSTLNQENVEKKYNPLVNLSPFMIGVGRKLSLKDIHAFKLNLFPVELSPESYPAMDYSHQFLRSCIDKRIPVYGLNTNFGDQVHAIDPHLTNDNPILYYESINRRQRNIIKSLSCSLGELVPCEIVKVTMLLRAHCISQGYSGVSSAMVQGILAFLNAGITPCVRRYGSIGASGDLIPLGTIASAMLGEKVDVYFEGKIMKAPDALKLAGLTPFNPHLRDGLAMINGTSFMTAITSLSLYRLNRLFWQMLSAIAMSLEAMLVISSAYEPLVHQIKHHLGQTTVNEFMRQFWQDSQLISHIHQINAANPSAEARRSIQDYYSLRSVPQGFGVFSENLKTAVQWVENEINSVNDNPIIDAAQQAIHNGANFMGYYITSACDMLKTDIAQASTWIHALLANMVHARKNHHLPTNLVEQPEINNGFRSIQLLAAAITVENRKLAQSQQAFMLPTEGDNQDVSSLGTHAAFDFKEAVLNLERLTALLFLASAQALEIRGINKASSRAQKIYRLIRNESPFISDCRAMTEEIHKVIQLLNSDKMDLI